MKLVGSTNPVCPYCGAVLEKMPQRKTKCPHCGEPILVRTRPSDGQRVVVTIKEAAEIEEQWNITIEMRPHIRQRSSDVLEKARNDLRKQFCKEPRENDVLWRVFNDEVITLASEGSWAIYTGLRFEMGELLMSEGRFEDALGHYLEAFYLQANGPRNIDPSCIEEGFPAFKPEDRIPERYVERILQMVARCELSPEKIESMFIHRANELQRDLKLPLIPAQAWRNLSVYL